jgi:SAM-dependent methyltransferase
MRTNDAVQKLYTDRGALYQRLFVDFLGWGRELETFFRSADYLRPHLKILDAGCGTGIITRVLYQLAQEQGHAGIQFHAFDLTPRMLEIFRQWITAQGADQIELVQADVLEIMGFPAHWKEYDLVVSSTMLEYLPPNQVEDALTNLKQMLSSGGILLIFITRRNRLTRWLAGKWWKTYTFEKREIQTFLQDVGFDEIKFRDFSPRWSKFIMVVEAKMGLVRAR